MSNLLINDDSIVGMLLARANGSLQSVSQRGFHIDSCMPQKRVA